MYTDVDCERIRPDRETKLQDKEHYLEALWFPVDDTGTVADQKKTICWLCQVDVAYSGNTSNLKSYFQQCQAQEHRALQQ